MESVICHPNWPEVVAMVFFSESIIDRAHEHTQGAFHTYTCRTCSPPVCFSSEQALMSHQRSKHGVRNPIRTYIDNSCVCPGCKTRFGNRLSVITHLSDKRRPKCREFVVQHCPPLDADTVSQLDLMDNELRKAGRKAGHSHQVVTSPAVSQSGRVVGRASC